jgi:hypothetical protein
MFGLRSFGTNAQSQGASGFILIIAQDQTLTLKLLSTNNSSINPMFSMNPESHEYEHGDEEFHHEQIKLGW